MNKVKNDVRSVGKGQWRWKVKDIKYVFFDIGYTLVNEDNVWEQRCKEQALTKEAKELGLTETDIYNEIVKASLAYQPQYRTVMKKYNFTEVAPYRSELEQPYEEAEKVLEYLSGKYKLGIIANQSDGLSERLEMFGIQKYFSLIISSWDYQVMKPDVKIFEIALDKAECKPCEAVMIGDRLDNDIFPAKSIRMKTIWMRQGFGGMQNISDEKYCPDEQVNSLLELMKIL